MDIRNRRAVRAAASESLAANPGDPRKVVLIYIAIMAVSALAVSALVTVLDNRIAETGGLADLGLRSILSTARNVLPLAQTIALWGLQLGYQKSTLHMARRQAADPHNLVEGFSRFGALLRSILFQMATYLVLSFLTIQAASIIFMLTPLSADFMELVVPMTADPNAFYNAIYTDTAMFAQVGMALLPMIPIWLVLFCVIAVPILFSWRMTNYCILDNRGMGALAAMGESVRMMKGHRLELLKLDLGFWWFWLGQAAVTAVLYGDVLLPMIGVTLPWSAEVSYYVFYVASLLLEGLLYFFLLNKVETTYATAYDILRPKPTESHGGVVLGNIFDLAKDYRDEDL